MSNSNELEKEVYDQSVKSKKGKSGLIKLEVSGLIINFLSISICSYALILAMQFKIPPEIIAVNDAGSFFEKVPLDISNKNDVEIKQWMTDKISEAFNYNFTNMNYHASKIAADYTPEASAYLDKFINGSNLAKKVKREAGIVKIVLSDNIKLQSGMVGSQYGWKGSTKAALTLRSKAGTVRLGRYNVSIIVIRANESENKDGLKIMNISMGKT